jgi:hypothetical protein
LAIKLAPFVIKNKGGKEEKKVGILGYIGFTILVAIIHYFLQKFHKFEKENTR